MAVLVGECHQNAHVLSPCVYTLWRIKLVFVNLPHHRSCSRSCCFLLQPSNGHYMFISSHKFTKMWQEHKQRLLATLQCLHTACVTLNQEKCQFAKRTLSFLGHVIHADGVSPDPNKARDVVNMNTPTIITELWWFLGMVKQGEIHPIDCWTAQTTHRPAEQQVHLAMATQCQSFRGLRQPWHHPQSWHGMISQQILNFLQMLLLRLGAVLPQKADGSEFRPVV